MTAAEIGKIVQRRRLALRMRAQDVQMAGGPSKAVLSKIENGDEDRRSPATWVHLAHALRWPADAFDRLARGEEPDASWDKEAVPQPPEDFDTMVSWLREWGGFDSDRVKFGKETIEDRVGLLGFTFEQRTHQLEGRLRNVEERLDDLLARLEAEGAPSE
jgi:hypothetical protein